MRNREASSSPPQPKYVRRGIAHLQRVLGVDPIVEFSKERWLLSVQGERAVLTWEFRYLSTGKLQYNKPMMLTINGETRPLAPGDDIRSLLNPPQAIPLGGTEVPVKNAPAVVQHNYWAIVNYLRSRDLEGVVRLTTQDGVYTLGLETEAKSLRMRFRQSMGRWSSDPELPIQLIIDGEDRTGDAGGNLAKALASMCGTPNPPASGPPGIGGSVGPARNNSVETRRSTVIRV